MVGTNAIYLAKQIGSWGLINMTEQQQLNTIKSNEVIVQAFKYAVDDLASIIYNFMDNNRRCNFYGYKMKFDAIEQIASTLAACLNNNSIWFSVCGKDFNRIAEDLNSMVDILKFEIDNNMKVVDSYEKSYKLMV
jgi:hypothetical protein